MAAVLQRKVSTLSFFIQTPYCGLITAVINLVDFVSVVAVVTLMLVIAVVLKDCI